MKNELVYIIEDDKDIRDNLIEILESEGFHVVGAENGKIALDCLQQGILRPCLMLVDLMMPVMDGRTFLSKVQAMPELQHIPIVVISAGAEIIEGNIVGFMKKPLDLDEVLSVAFKYCGS